MIKKVDKSKEDIEIIFKEWIKDGSEIKFNKIYKYYRPRVLSYLLTKQSINEKKDTYQLTRDELYDVLSDTFAKVYTKKHYFNPNFRVSTWVFTIAKNCLLDYQSSKKSRRYIYISQVDANNEDDSFFDEYLKDNIKESEYDKFIIEENPEQIHYENMLQQNKLLNNIRHFLETQNDIQYKWTYDILFNKRTFNEIGQLENKSPFTIRYHVQKVSEKIKDTFNNEYKEYLLTEIF